ncbi:CinA family protein [Streptomyces sp. TP-A0874]|uniref:CinA family protein n=1 Tax=Streptomyces sp. TP-A0874 TaxID=549819 RepID=UPI0008537BB2|nr:CinA family protein [Streptomyces sp. TP-A0874]
MSVGPAETSLQLLAERGQTLAVAESLTGGLVAAALTAVPGASRAFRGSVTAYATEVKHKVLAVDGALLQTRGAVDAQVAGEMADGVRRLLGADWGAATTGVAGPDPQDGQPVGTVHVAVAGPGGTGRQRLLRLDGDREEIRRRTVQETLELLMTELIGNARERNMEHSGGN